MEPKRIPLKNYVLVFGLIILVIVLTLYLRSWYNTLKQYNNNSVISDCINSIELETIESYVLDNSNFLLYIADSSDEEIKIFEKKFKKYINNNNLNDQIIYLDVKEYDLEYIVGNLLKYKSDSLSNLNNINIPNLLYFDNGKIGDIMYLNKTEINRTDVIKFIEKENFIQND